MCCVQALSVKVSLIFSDLAFTAVKNFNEPWWNVGPVQGRNEGFDPDPDMCGSASQEELQEEFTLGNLSF